MRKISISTLNPRKVAVVGSFFYIAIVILMGVAVRGLIIHFGISEETLSELVKM